MECTITPTKLLFPFFEFYNKYSEYFYNFWSILTLSYGMISVDIHKTLIDFPSHYLKSKVVFFIYIFSFRIAIKAKS